MCHCQNTYGPECMSKVANDKIEKRKKKFSFFTILPCTAPPPWMAFGKYILGPNHVSKLLKNNASGIMQWLNDFVYILTIELCRNLERLTIKNPL